MLISGSPRPCLFHRVGGAGDNGTGQPQLPGQHQQERSAVSISGRGLVCNVGALLVLRVPRSHSVYVTAGPVLSLSAVHSPLAWMARSRRSFRTSAIARFRAGPAAGWLRVFVYIVCTLSSIRDWLGRAGLSPADRSKTASATRLHVVQQAVLHGPDPGLRGRLRQTARSRGRCRSRSRRMSRLSLWGGRRRSPHAKADRVAVRVFVILGFHSGAAIPVYTHGQRNRE